MYMISYDGVGEWVECLLLHLDPSYGLPELKGFSMEDSEPLDETMFVL